MKGNSMSILFLSHTMNKDHSTSFTHHEQRSAPLSHTMRRDHGTSSTHHKQRLLSSSFFHTPWKKIMVLLSHTMKRRSQYFFHTTWNENPSTSLTQYETKIPVLLSHNMKRRPRWVNSLHGVWRHWFDGICDGNSGLIDWLTGVLTARQHRKVNLCQLRGKETGSVG